MYPPPLNVVLPNTLSYLQSDFRICSPFCEAERLRSVGEGFPPHLNITYTTQRAQNPSAYFAAFAASAACSANCAFCEGLCWHLLLSDNCSRITSLCHRYVPFCHHSLKPLANSANLAIASLLTFNFRLLTMTDTDDTDDISDIALSVL